jgi:hypothetical protein
MGRVQVRTEEPVAAMTDIFDDIDAVRWPLVLDTAGNWQESGECQEGHVSAFVDQPSDQRMWRWDAYDAARKCRAHGECDTLQGAKAEAEAHVRGSHV